MFLGLLSPHSDSSLRNVSQDTDARIYNARSPSRRLRDDICRRDALHPHA